MALRFWQLKRKLGLEVALLGVDGTGKSSVARALLCLPAPVEVVYMGDKEYTTWVRQLADRWKLPAPIPQLTLIYEFGIRRLCGWFSSVRGRVVVYDRHPVERLGLQSASLKQRIRNLLERPYAWRTDLTFWFTGDYSIIYDRKNEQPMARLEAMDRHIRDVLERYSIPYERIDVTKEDLESVIKLIASRVLAMYRERVSIDELCGVLRTIFE